MAEVPFDHAERYRERGWTGTIALPARQKAPPPEGFTGGIAGDRWPFPDDLALWRQNGRQNLGIRMPPNVVGLDEDRYKGGDLGKLEAEYGALPPTWTTTSRDDGSAIRWFRLPAGRGSDGWPNQPAPAIEIVRFGHRYAMAPPSIHPEGRVYQWYRPDGTWAGEDWPPRPGDLPELPEAWCDRLDGNRSAGEAAEPGEVREEAPGDRGRLLACRGELGEVMCARMAERMAARIAQLPSGRHPAALEGSKELVELAQEGHRGAAAALKALEGALIASRSGERRDAEREWSELMAGLPARLNPPPEERPADPCDLPDLSFDPDDGVGQADATTEGTTEPAASARPWRVDLGPFLRGDYSPPTPTVGLARTDGQKLLYAGAWHTCIGLTGCGKSWFGLAHAQEVLREGGTVTYLHFEESSPAATIARLRALGVSLAVIEERFVWADLDELKHYKAGLEADRPALVVLDGINAACARTSGLSPWLPESVAHYRKHLVLPAAALGAAVLSLGHPPKAKDRQDERHGYGATGWLDECDGVGFRMEASRNHPIRRGGRGSATLYSVKDRHGGVEPHGEPAKEGFTYLGSLYIDDGQPDTVTPDGFEHATYLRINAPDPERNGTEPDNIDALAGFVADVLADPDGPTGGTGAYPSDRALQVWLSARRIKFDKSDLDPALQRLEDAGRLTRVPYARGKARPGTLVEAQDTSPP